MYGWWHIVSSAVQTVTDGKQQKGILFHLKPWQWEQLKGISGGSPVTVRSTVLCLFGNGSAKLTKVFLTSTGQWELLQSPATLETCRSCSLACSHSDTWVLKQKGLNKYKLILLRTFTEMSEFTWDCGRSTDTWLTARPKSVKETECHCCCLTWETSLQSWCWSKMAAVTGKVKQTTAAAFAEGLVLLSDSWQGGVGTPGSGSHSCWPEEPD